MFFTIKFNLNAEVSSSISIYYNIFISHNYLTLFNLIKFLTLT